MELPPAAADEPPSGNPSFLDDYRSSRTRALVATGLLVLFGVMLAVSIESTQQVLDLLERIKDGGSFTEAELYGNDERQMTVGVVHFGVYLLAAIAFLTWIHRASVNIHALLHTSEDPPIRFSPGWAVGWWFVPIASLWMPYQVMKDLWARSHPPGTTDRGRYGLLRGRMMGDL